MLIVDNERKPTRRESEEYLSRQLLKEKVACPHCHTTMSLRQLRFRHVCKTSKPVDIEARKAALMERAVQALQARQS